MQEKQAKQNRARSSKHWAFGKLSGYRLENIGIPATYCQTAAATCRFTFQGPESVGTRKNGKNWGEWIRTRIQGPPPTSHRLTWQTTKDRWSSGDGHANAELILGCFHLTIEDVFTHWGQPSMGQRYELDLVSIVEMLAPALIVGDEMLADSDPRTHARGRQSAMMLV